MYVFALDITKQTIKWVLNWVTPFKLEKNIDFVTFSIILVCRVIENTKKGKKG